MLEYKLIRSNRSTLSMSISKELKVVIRAPLKLEICEIEVFINKHIKWIEKSKEKMSQRLLAQKANALTEEDIKKMKEKAKKVIPGRVAYYSKLMRVVPSSVKITSAASRWGSCSGKNGLCFTYRLMAYPMEAIDYIVVHELAHIRVKNHSSKFYDEVKKYMPDYKERELLLK